MRLAAQLRGGFYPASPKAIAHVATFLRPPKREPFTILDPCAGQGAAIRQLSEVLGCPQDRTYAIELDEGRAANLRAALPAAHVLAPANFFGCRATRHSFSFIWLNPPFDHSYGGYRVEDQFLRQATDWLLPGGLLALVCPEDVADEYSETRQHCATYYEQCMIVPFPRGHRPFHEVVVFGHKRARAQVAPEDFGPKPSWEAVLAPKHFVFRIPAGPGPAVFLKTEPTEPELQHLLASSPLRRHLRVQPEVPLPSPPLALGIGHVALLLASGHLDGVVHPQGQSPHVVRGTSRKRVYVSEVTDTTNADGSTTTRTTMSERIDLVVRTVDLTGRIQTFGETDAAEPGESPGSAA